MSRRDEYIARLETAFVGVVDRAMLAPADDVEPLNRLLDEYVVEMERARKSITDEDLQVALVVAKLKGLL